MIFRFQMEQDEALALPARRTTTLLDNVARVQADLASNMVAVRQAQEYAQPMTTINLSTPAFRLHDEPIGEDQQALLAEFERRRRVRNRPSISSFIFR